MEANKQEGIGKGFLYVILAFSALLAIFFGYNAYYYGQIVQPVDGTPAPISAGQSTTMMIINALLCFIFAVIFIWGMGKLLYSNPTAAPALDKFKESFNKKLEDFGKKISSIGSGSSDKKADGLTKEDIAAALAEKAIELKEAQSRIEKAKQDAEADVRSRMQIEADEKRAVAIRNKMQEMEEEYNKIRKITHIPTLPDVYVASEKVKALKDDCQKNKQHQEPKNQSRDSGDKGGNKTVDTNLLKLNKYRLEQLNNILADSNPYKKSIKNLIGAYKGAINKPDNPNLIKAVRDGVNNKEVKKLLEYNKVPALEYI